MIRFILTLIFVTCFLVGSIPLFFIEWIIGLINPDVKSRSSLAIVNWGFRVVIFLAGTKVLAIGEDNVPKDTPVLYVANHRSFYDIILTYVRVPRLTGYVAKKEILKVPLLRQWMKNLHCLFLDRENVKEGIKTILAAVEKERNGISICIFPEGTRNKKPDTLLPFHDGSFKIASKADVPVVPITMLNTAAIFEDHLPKIKKATVVIHYGEPVYIKDLDRDTQKNIGDYFRNLIAKTYAEDLEQFKDRF